MKLSRRFSLPPVGRAIRRRASGVGLILLLAACTQVTPPIPKAPVPYGAAITVDAQPVPLDRADPSRSAIGRFAYAGGVVLTSRQTARLHGLSDLKVSPDGRMIAISDQSDFLEARIQLDAEGRLTGLADARLLALKDEAGVDLYGGGQREFDSEGVVRLADGTLVASFEQHDRVLAWSRTDGPARAAPAPDFAMTFNRGMEAMTAAPDAGPDAYRVGLEDSGLIFLCRMSKGCQADGRVDVAGSELVAMDVTPDGGRAYLFRKFQPGRGSVINLRIAGRDGRTLDEMEIARPLTVDNFEGLAVTKGAKGAWRFYLIVDDNFGLYEGKPTGQTTLMFAFDWTPRKEPQ